MYTKTLLGVAVWIGLVFFCPHVFAEETTEEAEVDEVQLAYDEIRTGKLYEATIRLLSIMRNMPTDNAAQAHEFLEPAYLLAFTVAFLLDWPDRIAILGDVVNEELYEADRLGIAGAQMGLGLSGDKQRAVVATLMDLTNSSSRSIACGALFILSSPHFFEFYDHRKETMTRLLTEFPESSFGKYAARLNIYNNLQLGVRTGVGITPLLRGTPYEDDNELPPGQRRNAAQEPGERGKENSKKRLEKGDPILARSLAPLARYTVGAINPGIINAWIQQLKKSRDEDEICHLLQLLRFFVNEENIREQLEPVLRYIAEHGEPTSQAFVHQMLLNWARQDNNNDDIFQWASSLIKLERLPGAPEESLYESHLKAIQEAAAYLGKSGAVEEAIRLYSMLAEKYPSSLVARDALELIELLQAAQDKSE